MNQETQALLRGLVDGIMKLDADLTAALNTANQFAVEALRGRHELQALRMERDALHADLIVSRAAEARLRSEQ